MTLLVITDCIAQSRQHIQDETDADLYTTSVCLLQRLADTSSDLCQLGEQAVQAHEAITRPLGSQVLDWSLNDGTRSGNAILGQRLKKFEKIIAAEEKEIEQQLGAWSEADAQIRQLAYDLVGQDGFGRVMAGQSTHSTEERQQKELHKEVEVEKARLNMQIEKESKSSTKFMRESEKVNTRI